MKSRASHSKSSSSRSPAIVSMAGAGCGSAERLSRIAEAAYYKAEARGFSPGHEVEDWLAAEAEVEAEENLWQLH